MTTDSGQIRGAAIQFLQEGERLSDTAKKAPIIPVIRISIQPAIPSSPHQSIAGSGRLEITALIDTGADSVYIDSHFAERNGFQSNRTATVFSASATTEEKVYPAIFQLSESASHNLHAADFIAAPLRSNGRNYDAVLGMQFLSNGALVMDFDSHVYRFEFTTKPNK